MLKAQFSVSYAAILRNSTVQFPQIVCYLNKDPSEVVFFFFFLLFELYYIKFIWFHTFTLTQFRKPNKLGHTMFNIPKYYLLEFHGHYQAAAFM